MKLFQIEEPDGRPGDRDAPGAAIGIDVSGAVAEVAVSVGGNALRLADREGFEQALPVPAADAAIALWQEVLEAARVRAERALARPVTHAVLAVADPAAVAERLAPAAAAAGLGVLRIVAADELTAAGEPALAAAIIAEDLAPPPDPGAAG